MNRASSDLARAMAAKQRRSETEKKAQEKKAEQEAAKKAKEIVDAQKKGAGANDKVSCLMLQDVFTGALKQAIQAFETEEEFQKAKDDEGRPYIVRKAQAWVDLCENTADFKGLMEVFQAQFPASPACSNSGGRCQAPIKTLSGQTFAKVMDTLAAYLPAWVEECDFEAAKNQDHFLVRLRWHHVLCGARVSSPWSTALWLQRQAHDHCGQFRGLVEACP